MSTSPLPTSGSTGQPPLVYDQHPRTSLQPETMGVNNADDVVRLRGRDEAAAEIAALLKKEHHASPEEALRYEQKRLAYEQVKQIRESFGAADGEREKLKKAVKDAKEAVQFRIVKDNEANATRIRETMLVPAEEALKAYGAGKLNEAHKEQVVAYGKKRLAQLASLERYLRHSTRKEKMQQELEEIRKTPLGSKAENKGLIAENLRLQKEYKGDLELEQGKGAESNAALISSLQDQIKELEDALEGLIGEETRITETEQILEHSIQAEGLRGATQGANVTLDTIVAERKRTIEKLQSLGVSDEEMRQIVLYHEREAGDGRGAGEKEAEKGVTTLLRTDTGERITDITQLIPSWAGVDNKEINKVVALSAPHMYIVTLTSSRTTELLIQAVPGRPVELLSGGEQQKPKEERRGSEVKQREALGQKIIICSDGCTKDGKESRTYKIYDAATGDQVNQDIEVQGRINFENEISEGHDRIVEVDYAGPKGRKKGLMNVYGHTQIIGDEDLLDSRYELLCTNTSEGHATTNLQGKLKERERTIGTGSAFLEDMKAHYHMFAHPNGTLCLINKLTGRKVGYISPECIFGRKDDGQYVVVVYGDPGENKEVDLTSPGTCIYLPSEEKLQENVAPSKQMSDLASRFGLQKQCLIVTAADGSWVAIDYINNESHILGSGNIDFNTNKSVICIKSGAVSKLYYVTGQGSPKVSVDYVGEFGGQGIVFDQYKIIGMNDQSPYLILPVKQNEKKTRYYVYNKATGGGTKLYKTGEKADEIGDGYTLKLYEGSGVGTTIFAPGLIVVITNDKEIHPKSPVT